MREPPFDQRRPRGYDYAEFSGLHRQERLYISAVVHEAFVAGDEAGTEATAAAVIAGAASAPLQPPPSVRVDRPFVFLIRDRPTGEVLFLGRVVDPSVT